MCIRDRKHSAPSMLCKLMRQPTSEGRKVFKESDDFCSAVNDTFRLLKRIPARNTSAVDPLAEPVAGKVGYSNVTLLWYAHFGSGCPEEKSIPIKAPECDMPSEFLRKSKFFCNNTLHL